MNIMKLIYIFTAVIAISGCSGSGTKTSTPTYNMDQIYTKVNRQGKRETVQALRDGLRMNHSNGSQDPFVPIRNPALVVPIWVPTQTHPMSGERISGHWKWLEVEEESWTN